jgi:hypothetical protein
MPHPVIYLGNFNALLKEWDEKWKQTYKEQGDKGLRNLMIGSGECVALPQGLTSVGYTGRWQPGARVINVAKTLKPGTVIANFMLKDGRMVFPSTHGYHAALFIGGEGYSTTTGKPSRISMFDQWRGDRPKWPSPRSIPVIPDGVRSSRSPSDRGEAFYVVLVP